MKLGFFVTIRWKLRELKAHSIFILTLDLCRASLKTTLCDVGSLLKDLIYYCYYYNGLLVELSGLLNIVGI